MTTILRAILFTFLVLLFTTQTKVLESNFANPILLANPYASTSTDLNLQVRFSFPEAKSGEIGPSKNASPTLDYLQVIAIQAEKSFFTSPGTCSLKTSSITYTMTSSLDSSSLNTVFCRLADRNNQLPLSVTENNKATVYTLTYSATNQNISTKFFNFVTIYTATSDKPNRVILSKLDYSLNFALTKQPVNKDSTSVMQILSDTVDTSLVSAGTSFNMEISCEILQSLIIDDYIFLVTLTDNSVASLPSQISSSKFSDDSNHYGISDSLTLKDFDTNYKQIVGIKENFVKGRKFKLKFSNLVAKTKIGISTKLQLWIYYKNTLTPVCMAETEQGVSVKSGTISTFYYSHESNGAALWEYGVHFIKIFFKSGVKIPSGYAISFQHTSWVKRTTASYAEEIIFVASTCQFSESSGDFDKKLSCFNLHQNEIASESDTEGDGFFFITNQELSANKEYSITIAVLVNACGKIGEPSTLAAQRRVMTLTLSIFDKINTTEVGSSRLSSPLYTIDSTSTTTTIKCVHTYLGEATASGIYTSDLRFNPSVIDYSATTGVETLAYREEENFVLSSANPQATIPNAYNAMSEYFIYDSTYGGSKYLHIIGKSVTQGAANAYKPFHFLPVYMENDGGVFPIKTGSVVFLGMGAFIEVGDSTCSLKTAVGLYTGTGYDANVNGAYSETSKTSTSELNNSEISNHIRVGAVFDNSSATPTSNWNKMTVATPGGTNIKSVYYAYYTNCMKVAKKTTLTSLYSYLDFQAIVSKQTSSITWSDFSSKVVSVHRFMKLFPQGGVFQNPVNYSPTKEFEFGSSAVFHSTIIGVSENAVCLLELQAQNLRETYISAKQSDTFILWLFGVSLLETEYTSVTTYPVGNLASGVKVYASQAKPFSDSVTNTGIYSTNIVGISYESYIMKTAQNLDNSVNIDQNSADNKRSHYMMFMSSVLYFRAFSQGAIGSNETSRAGIYIPHYCPHNGTGSTIGKYYPLVMGGWFKMSAYNSITEFSTALYGTGKELSTNMNPTSKLTVGSVWGKERTQQSDILLGSFRWASYSIANSLNSEIINATAAASGSANVLCTYLVILTESTIIIDATLSTNVTQEKTMYPSFYDNFYFFGLAFNKAVFAGRNSNNGNIGNQVNIVSSSDQTSIRGVSVVGLTRPNIATIVKGDQSVAFWCGDLFSGVAILTNVESTSSSSRAIPIVDIGFAEGDFPTRTFSSEGFIFIDNANAITLNLIPSGAVPSGSKVKVNSSAFTTSALCGITSSKFLSTPCTMSNGAAECVTDSTLSAINICCYNISITQQNYTTLSVSSAEINFTNPFGTASKHFSLIYKQSHEFKVGNYLTETLVTPRVTLSYTYSTQKDAFGIANFEVTLGRVPGRGAIIKLEKNDLIERLLIPGITPACSVSFIMNTSAKSVFGDIFVERCYLDSENKEIVVSLKNELISCNKAPEKRFNIKLYPVRVSTNTADKTIAVSSTTLGMNSESKDTITINLELMSNSTQVIPSTLVLSPSIQGLPTMHIFSVDLTKATFKGETNINEITLYFPPNLYKAYANTNCILNSTTKLNCFFEYEHILTVRLENKILERTAEVTTLTINNLEVPLAKSVTVAIALNDSDYLLNTRSTYFNSTATTQVTPLDDIKLNGSLRFFALDKDTPIVNKTVPQEVAQYIFRIGLDRVLDNNGSDEITITTKPNLYIIFPPEFTLLSSFTPILTIEEYVTNSSTNVFEKSATLINVQSVSVLSDTISVQLTSDLIFKKVPQFFQVTLGNIPNPQSVKEASTGQFNFVIKNQENTMMFKTFKNMNNIATVDYKINDFIAYARGTNIKNKTDKWVLSFEGISKNYLTCNTGRFSKAILSVDSYDGNLKPEFINLTLNDSTFSLGKSFYEFATNKNEKLEILIGCKCTAKKGYYTTAMTIMPSDNFYSFPFFTVSVRTDTKGEVEIPNVLSVPGGTEILFGVTISESNVEEMKLSWALTNSVMSTSSLISNVIFPVGTKEGGTVDVGEPTPVQASFSYNGSTTSQKYLTYTASISSSCYVIKGKNETVINIDNYDSSFKVTDDYRGQFKFENKSKIPAIQNYNDIKVTFVPLTTPVMLYCAIFCAARDYPTISEIKYNNASSEPQIFSLFKRYVKAKTYNIEHTFTNLSRQEKYKVKCIIEEPLANLTSSKRVIITSDDLSYNSTLNNTITVVENIATSCISFMFTEEPDPALCKDMTNKFALNSVKFGKSYKQMGCPIYKGCDFVSTGLELRNKTCSDNSVIETKNNSLRFLQNSTTANSTSSTSAVIKTICVFQDPLCPTNVETFSTFKDFSTNVTSLQDFKTFFNLTLIPPLRQSGFYQLVTDDITPDLTTSLITNQNIEIDGTFSFNLKVPVKMNCFYKINRLTDGLPSTNEIKSCNEFSRCGNKEIQSQVATQINQNQKTEFYEGLWRVHITCSNPVPFSKKFSMVKSADLGKIEFPNSDGKEINATLSSKFLNGKNYMTIIVLLLLII